MTPEGRMNIGPMFKIGREMQKLENAIAVLANPEIELEPYRMKIDEAQRAARKIARLFEEVI